MASYKTYELKDGSKRWRCYFYAGKNVDGSPRLVGKAGFHSKSQARLYAVRKEAEALRHGFSEPNMLTFQDVYEEWFKSYRNQVKESTWAKTQDNYRLHVLPVFGAMKLTKITPMQCQNAVNDWFKAGFSKYQTFLNLVSRVFQYAIRMNLTNDDPTKKVIIPRDRNKPITTMADNYYTRDELKQFFRALEDRDDQQQFTFFRLLAYTGMRKGEALALQWSDIDFVHGTISIARTQTRGAKGIIVNSPKTFNSIRTINVDRDTLNILKKWQWQQRQDFMQFGVEYGGADQIVFSTRYNTMIGPAQPVNWLDTLQSTYNLKHVTPHGFRHTYATLAFAAGLTIKEVQKQLGHRSFMTTMDVYTSVTKSQDSEMAATYAKYLNQH